MKNVVFTCFILLIVSCGFNSQKKEMETLAKCTFSLEKIDKATIAGTSVTNIVKKDNVNLLELPAVVMGYMNKKLPFDAVISLQITNPTKENAAINAFDYIILFEDTEIASGIVDQSIHVDSGSTQIVPISIKGDVYELVQNNGDKFIAFLTKNNTTAKLTFKVKPSIKVAGTLVKAPTYFTINKSVTREMFLR